MKFVEWTKNKSKGIDNDELSDSEIQKVFIGEAAELIEAFFIFTNKPTIGTLLQFWEETFDVIQSTLGLIRRVRRISYNNVLPYEVVAQQATVSHTDKITDRGWQVDESKVAEFNVLDYEEKTWED